MVFLIIFYILAIGLLDPMFNQKVEGSQFPAQRFPAIINFIIFSIVKAFAERMVIKTRTKRVNDLKGKKKSVGNVF